MRKVISLESIQSAIHQLQKEGKRPSIHNIRAITGGSNRLIMQLKAEVLGDSNVTIKQYGNVTKNDNNYDNDKSRLNSLEAKVKELEQTVEQLKKTIAAQNYSNEKQQDDNVSVDDLMEMYELWQGSLAKSAQAEEKLKQLQLASSDVARESDFKTGACIQKLSEVEKVITKWRTKCTPERAKGARWQKAYDLLIELREVTEQQSIL